MHEAYVLRVCSASTREALLFLLRQCLAAVQKVAAGALRAGNVVQAAHVENADGVGRPRSREVEARTHLRQILLITFRVQKRLVGEPLRVVALAQQPGQYLHITP